MPNRPAEIADGDQLGASWLMEWFAYLESIAQRATVTVKEGCGLSLRRNSAGTEIGLEAPPYTYGVVTQQVSARSGDTPGVGQVQPYYFTGATFKPVGAPMKVFNKSKQTVAANFRVSWNFISGFPFLDWSDCGPG